MIDTFDVKKRNRYVIRFRHNRVVGSFLQILKGLPHSCPSSEKASGGTPATLQERDFFQQELTGCAQTSALS
jgi:hypothetical protein